MAFDRISIQLILICSLGLGLAAPADEPAPDPQRGAADQAYEAIQSAGVDPFDPVRAADAVLDFAVNFPGDKRVPLLLETKLPCAASRRLSAEERAACEARFLQRFPAAIETPGLDDMAWGLLMKAGILAEINVQKRAAKPETARARALIDVLTARSPQLKVALTRTEMAYTELLEKIDFALGAEHLGTLTAHPNEYVARVARGNLNIRAAYYSPMEMKFVAIDGRVVDLAALRGKVVLVDFWATWCGPCKLEIPNIKAVYEKYHDKGFEVIAVAMDKEADKQKLIDYCKTNDLPWPQHFDGGKWDNEYAKEYGIMSIPAMFLLNQEGRIVNTDARGERLEKEVTRLLARRERG